MKMKVLPRNVNQVSLAIVGGGILGMELARQLHPEGFHLEILESSPRLGGLASEDRIGGYTWDRFYHVILLSDLRLRSLLQDLDLENELQWSTTKTGFYSDGELYSLSNSIEFLRFPPLSLIDKLRLCWTVFYASRVTDWKKLEQILVSDWLIKLSGKRVFEKIWLPLLKSKLGQNYRKASAAFIWATIQRLYAARQSGLKHERFGYVKGGYSSILDRFRRHLDQRSVFTRFGSQATRIEQLEGKVKVSLSNGTSQEYDSVIVTLPTPLVADLCPQLTVEETRRLRSVTYQGIVCASVLLRKPLADFYVTNIIDEWVPFTGIIEMTALVDRSQFGGNSLVYLPRYLPQDDSFWSKTDDEIQQQFLSALDRMYPEFSDRDVLDFRISRARQVLAVPTLDYSESYRPLLTTSVPGVFVLNSAQITNGTLNVNETLGLVHEQLPILLTHLRERHSPLVNGKA